MPGLELFGGLVLVAMLLATAAWSIRKRTHLVLPVTLVLIAIPLAVAAGTLTVPNSFVNGTVADADEVNENFSAVQLEVNDNDARIDTAQAAADGAAASAATALSSAVNAQSTANTAGANALLAVSAAAAAQATADAAQVEVTGSCPPGQSIRVINSDGTVTCEVDTDTNTTYSAGAGLSQAGTQFSLNASGCVAGEVLKRNSTNTAWTCEPATTPSCTRRSSAVTTASTFYNHVTASCLTGEIAISGGFASSSWNTANDQCHFIRSQPNSDGTGWDVTLGQPSGFPCSGHSFRAYALCCTF